MKSVRAWLGPLLISLVLNMLFFSFMPLLTDQRGTIEKNRDLPRTINVVRFKKKDTQVRKKDKKPPPEKEKKIVKKAVKQPPKKAQNRKISTSPQIPFELNHKLPSLAGMPAFPLETVQLDAPDMNRTFDASQIDNSLTPLVHIPPLYPFQAKRRGIQGWVKIQFMVNLNGGVEQIKIIDAEPLKIFDQSVINAVSQWRFTPGTVSGTTVNTQVVTTIRFQLEQ